MQTVLLGLLFLFLFSGLATGIPVMFSLLGASVLVGSLGIGLGAVDPTLALAIPGRIFGILENQVLYAIPLFILIGKILEHTSLAASALHTVSRVFGASGPRSLALSVIAVSVLIGCSSGVAGATITMLAALALPTLHHAGIGERQGAGLIVASGTLGQILPPSIVLILLSDQISNAHTAVQQAQGNFAPDPVSVGHLFAAALLPGLLLAGLYAIYTLFALKGTRPLNDQPARATTEIGYSTAGLAALLGLLSVPAAILLGIATPTEAAAVGTAWLMVMSVLIGQANNLPRALEDTAELTGIVYGIIMAASVFALLVRGLEGDLAVQALLSGISENPDIALAFVLLIVFVLGFLMEFVEITYVVVPVMAPALFALGVDPVWFAILLAVNLQISFLTPPMGISLFYYKSVSSVSAVTLYRSVMPFILLQILVMGILFMLPAVATWLPSVLV